MITCKECIYWEFNENLDETYREKYYNDCKLDGDKFLYDPNCYDKDNRAQPDSLMYCDSDGYNAWFKTGPDFGCIHGKKKE